MHGQASAVRRADASPRGAAIERWWMVAVLLALYVLSSLDRTIIVMLVEPIRLDLGLTDFQMSLILGPAFGLFYAVFGFPLGWAADRLPRRAVIGAGVFLWSLATMACGLANSFASLFVSRAAVGVGEASLSPAAYSLIADKFPRERLATAIAVYTLGPRVGNALAFTLGALAITLATQIGTWGLPFVGALEPWQTVCLIVGAPGVLMMLLAFSFSEPPRGAHAVLAASGGGLLEHLSRSKALFALLLCGFGAVAIGSGADNWVPAYISRRFGLEPIQYGPILSAINLAAAGAVLVKGRLVDWLYARGMADAHLRLFTWLLVPTIALAAVAFAVPNAIGFMMIFGVMQLTTMGYVMFMASTIQLVTPPHLRSRVSAIFLLATSLGGTFGPMAVGALTDFVFRDPARIGWSLGVVLTSAPTLALLAHRFALRAIRPMLAPADAVA